MMKYYTVLLAVLISQSGICTLQCIDCHNQYYKTALYDIVIFLIAMLLLWIFILCNQLHPSCKNHSAVSEVQNAISQEEKLFEG